MFKFFSAVWQKLLWLINFIYVYVSPIYKDVISIIKDVQSANLQDDAARKEVFKRITAILKAKGLNLSDSLINAIIEICYQIYKQGKA
jgi:hypothetical protein